MQSATAVETLFRPRAKTLPQRPNQGANEAPALDNSPGMGRCISILQLKLARLNVVAFALLGDTGQHTPSGRAVV